MVVLSGLLYKEQFNFTELKKRQIKLTQRKILKGGIMKSYEDLQAVEILLIEDDLGDQKLIKLSLKKQSLANKLTIIDNCEEALEYLNAKVAEGYGGDIPALVLLDLNLPGMNGKELLKIIKNDSNLKSIPVIILTTSNAERDILESYQLHANGYVKKPVKFQDLIDVINEICRYWFIACKTPSHK